MYARDISRDIMRDRTRPETTRPPMPAQDAPPLAVIRSFREVVAAYPHGDLYCLWVAGVVCPFCQLIHEHACLPEWAARKPWLGPYNAPCGHWEGAQPAGRIFYRATLSRLAPLRPAPQFRDGGAWPDDDGGKAS